jgi:hypothetical protein
MLPIIPIAMGVSALVLSIAGALALRRAPRPAHPVPRSGPDLLSAQSPALNIKILKDQIIEDDSAIIGTEEVPLDNRYGNEIVVSEFEFTRSASNAIVMERTREVEAALGVNALSLVQAEAEVDLREKLGFTIGAEIRRSIKLKLAAGPGTRARYRITWKQDTRRGLYEVQIGKRKYDIPYVATYGLCHDVQSLSENGVEDTTEETTVSISEETE